MNACRHYKGMFPDRRSACAKGRDVRAWAVRCNGGSEFGIGLRLPCTKQNEDQKPLFDCPDLDRRTDEEVAARRAEMDKRVQFITSAMPRLFEMKETMIANNLATAKATCPWCGEKNALQIGIALDVNQHMRVHCRSCNKGFLE